VQQCGRCELASGHHTPAGCKISPQQLTIRALAATRSPRPLSGRDRFSARWRITHGPFLTRCIYALAGWTSIVLIYSTRNDISGLPLTPSQALKAAAARWYVWAALSYFIIRLDDHLPISQGALWKRFLVHVPISYVFIAAYTWLNYWICVLTGAPIDVSISSANNTVTALLRAFTRPSNLVYWVILMTHVVLKYERQKHDQEVKTAKLESLLADARLATLRAQLHPHFLFDSLNAISAYIETTPRTARLMLEQVGDLLRMSLDNQESQEIPLHEELAFLDKYLGLQKMRFEDRLEVRIQMDPSAASAFVPTFILQPLVENAIRHGVAMRHEKTAIEISARRIDGHLGISIRNDGPGLPEGWTIDSGLGVGISNTKDRLAALYGVDHQRLDIRNAPEGGVVVTLTLPFHVNHPSLGGTLVSWT